MTAVIFAFHDLIYDVQDALIYGDQKPLTRAGNPLETPLLVISLSDNALN